MSNQTTSNYINLHAEGIGYLQRVREVVLTKGRKSSFWSADLNMMHGEKGVDQGITYVPFQVNPANEESLELLKDFAELANSNDHTVMVRSKVSDFYPETFTQTKGQNAGQIRTVLKGRLILVTHVWVKDKRQPDSKFVLQYERPRADNPEHQEQKEAA